MQMQRQSSSHVAFPDSLDAKRCGCILLVLFFLAPGAFSQSTAPVTAVIDINTSVTTPIAPNFSGINDDLRNPVEYWDYRFNALAATLGAAWVRFPGGTTSDIYNWQTGEDSMAWYSEFPASSDVGMDPDAVAVVAGRGGAKLIDAANRANLLGASLIICVNGFTDTAASAGQLAAYVKANNIQVAAWELSNEAYLFPTFWATATAYLDAMKPYRDAIKAVLPNAIVAVFASDQSNAKAATDPWDLAIAAYTNKYWDAITFHDYPDGSTGAFAQWMADECANLAGIGPTLIERLTGYGPLGVRIINTEFDPSLLPSGGTSLTDGTVFGGIYAAEYTMRLSASPSVLHVGPNALTSVAGVLLTNDNRDVVEAAAASGTTTDTTTLKFGFYVSAQGLGLSVLNNIVNRAVQANQTTVTGGATVAARGMANIPALYAMSYTNAQGGLSVVITNKSATPHQVTVSVNGTAAAGTFPLQFVAASDPSTANTPTATNTVSVQNGTSANPVTVPAYSVLSAALTAPPVVVLVNSASYQTGTFAPQQIVTAFGSGFASQVISASNAILPATLGDTSIVITDSRGQSSSAPLLYVSSSQANFLIPSGLAAGAAILKVNRTSGTVLTGTLTIASSSPGLFSANGNGAGVASAQAESVTSSGTAVPLSVYSCQRGVALSCLSTPVNVATAPGTVYLELYGTGFRGAGTLNAYVAGQLLPVQFAGAQGQYQGLDQVNIALPKSLAGMGEVSVYLVADGQISNMVTVNIL
jgi:uncharacterized protein (TIGR03437 family)